MTSSGRAVRERALPVTAPVILIEDDEGDALLVRACLHEAGIPVDDVHWHRTLAEGLPALTRHTRCVLLDLGLPDADGLSALSSAVTAAPDTPIIVLTGRHDHTGTEALALGAQDYLVKDDITPVLLERSIRYAVERKRAQRTSLQLREARISSAEKARLERGLLPTPLIRAGHVGCSTYYQPGRDHAVLGGDFFDLVETSDGRVRALIGDVMGHGPEEAAIGVHLRVAWRTLVLAGTPDAQILPILQTLLAAETAGDDYGFVTACDVTIEPDGAAALRVAGHPAPLLCADGKTRYLDVQVGPPLGVDAGLTRATEWGATGGWPESRAQADRGSSLILYTDGLLDAFGGDDSQSLGIDELVEAVNACGAAGGAVSSWVPTIVASAPSQSVDDTAVVVITMRGPSAS